MFHKLLHASSADTDDLDGRTQRHICEPPGPPCQAGMQKADSDPAMTAMCQWYMIYFFLQHSHTSTLVAEDHANGGAGHLPC